MGLNINSSIPALGALRQTNRSINRLNSGLEQLSSALRINRAADDAAGLAIAERFRTQVRQLNQEVGALQSGVNIAQTAEGALESQGAVVSRLQELATQAANGTLTDEQRGAINAEAQDLLGEIDAIAQDTEFNGTSPLDGSQTEVVLDVDGAEVITFNESTLDSLGLTDLDLSTAAGAQSALGALESAAAEINTNRASLGAEQNGLERSIEGRSQRAVNLQDAESRIRDLDVALAAIEQSRNEVLVQGGLSALIQGNVQNRNALTLLGG